MFHSYTPWKHQKTRGFAAFSEGVEMEHWREMSWFNLSEESDSFTTQLVITYSKLTIQTIEQGVKYVKSYQ